MDVTSKGPDPWVRFSPFYPHGDIPVPGESEMFAASVEGVWQGLKVFESADVDPLKFEVTSMKGLKRTVRRFGECLGHRWGTDSSELLGYREARYRIYLPTYLWVLQNKLERELERLHNHLADGPVILLDYETNLDVEDLNRPLSHAGLIRAFATNSWPPDLQS